MKFSYCLLACVLTAMTGCSTTNSSRALAQTTAGNAAVFASEIQKYDERQRHYLKTRQQNIKRFSEHLSRARKRTAILKLQIEDSQHQKVEIEMRDWLAQLQSVQSEFETAAPIAAVELEWLDRRKALVRKLSDLSRQMLILAQDSNPIERAKFMGGYIKAVAEHTKNQFAVESAQPGSGLSDKLQQLTQVQEITERENE